MDDLARVGRALRSTASFVRLSALGGTLILPVLGAAAARPVGSGDVPGLLAAGAAFHVFAYVLNDVVDLPLDRDEPRRARSPLVRGVIGRGTALTIALGAVPVAFALARSTGAAALAALGVAFACLAVYDLFGKRCPFPPLTDLVQGAGWAALAVHGALATGRATVAVAVVAAFVVLFILLANGVHGPLRDLDRDVAFGARTTAVMLGACQVEQAGGRIVIPPAVRAYAVALHVAAVATVVVPTALGVATTGSGPRLATAAAALALAAAGSAFLAAAGRAARQPGNVADLRLAGMMHLLTTLPLPVAMLWPRFDPPLRAVVVAVYVLPLLAHGWLPAALRWTARAMAPAPLRGERAR